MAHLQMTSLLKPELDTRHWEELFLGTYRKLSPQFDMDSLRFFTAATHFRLACRRQLRSRSQEITSSLLGLASRLLEPPKGPVFQEQVLPC